MKFILPKSVVRATALCVIVSGCVSIEKSYPDKHYYVLQIDRREDSDKSHSSAVLLVANLRVSPLYDGRSFVYRLSEANYETDFYNQFLVSPGALFTEQVRRALSQAQIAAQVVGSASQLEPTHVLDGTVDALYGDFRDRGAPKAILEMEFFLSKDSPSRAEIVAQKRYRKSIPIRGRTAEALVGGWNMALNEILTALEADLKRLNF